MPSLYELPTPTLHRRVVLSDEVVLGSGMDCSTAPVDRDNSSTNAGIMVRDGQVVPLPNGYSKLVAPVPTRTATIDTPAG